MPSNRFSKEQELEICRKYQTQLTNGDFPTAIEIASEYACSDVTIRNIIRRNGIVPRQNKGRLISRMHDPQTEIAICTHYWTKLPTGFYPSYDETGQAFNCTGGHVRDLLKRHGYKVRTNAETRDHRACRPIRPAPGPAPLCACGCGNPVEWLSKMNRWYKFAPGHYHGYRIYNDPEWLRNEYINKLRSVEEIAIQCHVTPSSISKAMQRAGIQCRTLSESLIKRGSVSKEKNPAWKGGCAEWDYAPDWKRICKGIKDRDKWTCQHCGETRKRWGVHLHVHHIDGNKLNNHPDNLISLCAKCHMKAHYPKP